MRLSDAINYGYNRIRGGVGKASLLYLASRLLPAVLQMAAVAVFIRLIGQEEYGRYAILAASAVLVGSTGATWLAQSILRYKSQCITESSRSSFDAAIRDGSRLSMIGVILFSALMALGTSLNYTSVICTVIFALGIYWFSIEYAEAQLSQKPVAVVAAEALRGVVTFIIPLGLIYGIGLDNHVPLLLGAGLGNAAGAWILKKAAGHRYANGFGADGKLLKQFAKFGFPLTMWMGISLLLSISDRYIIEWTLGTGALGAYAAVYDVVYKSTMLVLAPVLLASHPEIMLRWGRGNPGEALKLVRKTEIATLVIGCVAALGWLIAGRLALPYVLGEGATEAVPIAPLVAVGAVLWSVAMVSHKPLELRDRTMLMCLLAGSALVLQTITNALLLPIFGLGVAPISMIAAVGAYICMVRIASYRLGPIEAYALGS